jgi:mono/diheme cytochrome c family protein
MNASHLRIGPLRGTTVHWPAMIFWTALSASLAGWGTSQTSAAEVDQLERGQAIYGETCASCHGGQGEGVEGAYNDPLIGDESIGQLAARIELTMPEGEPEECVGEDAAAVAAYMHHQFYSEAAQVRNRPPRIGLARLTGNQLKQSLADLYEQFAGHADPNVEHGVNGTYFDGERWKEDKKKIQRCDPVLDFDFGHEGPGEGIAPDSFYIYWEGGIRAEVSGQYEIVVNSTSSFVMNFGHMKRELIDNHTQSGDKTEFRRSIMLTAGRVYPFKIDFTQRKRKTEQPPASFRLSWVPPGGVEQIIPQKNLWRYRSPPTFSLQTPLPPDDRSYGFERGIAIDRQWDESTTAAALEFGHIATAELWPSYLKSHEKEPGENRDKMRAFLGQLASTAFRQPLTDELREVYINKQLAAEEDDAEAIKRALLIILKSPRFLYPAADVGHSASQRVANRLTLILYDSLPVEADLLSAIAENRFHTPEQVREYFYAHQGDLRLHAKVRNIFREWLNIADSKEIAKNAEDYPGFDARLVDDLRQSLDAFIDEVAWGETGDYRQFFNANWAFTTPRIAEFYGENWQPAEAFSSDVPVRTRELPAGAHHGVLTHPYLLSRLAYHDNSSPIHRGVFLIRYVLGRTLRPPAEAFSPLSPDLHPDLTTRERVDLQTSPESCQVCHQKINGLGFTLENYDAAGRYRAEERGKAIDPSGTYTSRDDQVANFATLSELSDYLVHSPDAQRSLVNRVFQFLVKQPAAAYGVDTLDQLTEKLQQSGGNVRELIAEIAVLAATQPLAE